jgi:hypothetical protein
MALACVPMMLNRTRYQGMLLLDKKYPSRFLVVRLLYNPYTTMPVNTRKMMIQSSFVMNTYSSIR